MTAVAHAGEEHPGWEIDNEREIMNEVSLDVTALFDITASTFQVV